MTARGSSPEPTIDLHDQAPARQEFARAVLAGLRNAPKHFPTAHLYDDRGALLFEQICETPEYYVTRTETAILGRCLPEVAELVGPHALVVEPGSGSGIKTRLLLEALPELAAYVPIDIAREQLLAYADTVNRDFPAMVVRPVLADFHGPIDLPIDGLDVRRTLVFFPGSTIGNMLPTSAVKLLSRMRALAGDDGAVLIGVDRKKDRATLEAAYDDAGGVSAEFALNVLDHINRELDADFDRDAFQYYAEYQTGDGRIEMGLVSRIAQQVSVDGEKVRLGAGERIRTEWSYKYSPDEFAALAAAAGWRVDHLWSDDEALFSVQYLRSSGD